MSRSPSRSRTSVAVGVALGLLAACGDDECGTMGAAADGVSASSADVTLTYTALTSLLGNDCPDAAAPAGVVSLSIEGVQVDGADGRITLCIRRPDLLAQGGRRLGLAQTSSTDPGAADVQIIDLTGSADGCTYALDPTRPPTGTASAQGVCGNDPDGFALELDGNVSIRRVCMGIMDTIAVSLAGTVAVTRRAP